MSSPVEIEKRIQEFKKNIPYMEKTKDIVDQLLHIILNYRQSGHPGGSLSKVHMFLTLLLSGAMRWDIRNHGKRFGDRFILSAGHAIPLIYCTLAVLNEAMRTKYKQTGDNRYALPTNPEFVLTWEDLLNFRHRGGLSGHAEMEGKTLFLKFNSGVSGHGSAVAVGEALALKRAGASGVKVFAIEGEGGLTAGCNHESMNSAWGLKLDNLYYLIDWNNFGIDDHPVSTIIYGGPEDWFGAHGWRVKGSEKGDDWTAVATLLLETISGESSGGVPSAIWTKNRKGRDYLKYDNSSHGAAHPINSDLFWKTKQPFMERYGVKFENYGNPAPKDSVELKKEFKKNLQVVIDVLKNDQELIDFLTSRLVEIGDSVPDEISGFRLNKKGNPYKDERIYDFKHYPADLYAKPGDLLANRAALGKWGAWINAFGAKEYDQPLFIACSADLCDSTNLAGFGKPYDTFPGYGWYEKKGTDEGVLLPQAITEMANSGLLCGMASVNFSKNIEEDFSGFWGACSTYGSFSYLKYGMFRLFSQLTQDCQWKMGKVLWVAGHSGPETADDSRTHFGIYSPGVTQLFPKGQIINLYPWEYNEVPVLLASALKEKAPIIALHLTRPPIEIPDRKALGIPNHFEASKGAYIVRGYKNDQPKTGMIIVQGTSSMANIVKILPELEKRKLNVKIVYAASPELFELQPKSYKTLVISDSDKLNSTFITTQARMSMQNWNFNPIANEYAISSDWDDRWRTGGTLDEVLDEAHMTPDWLLKGIEKFSKSYQKRMERLQTALD